LKQTKLRRRRVIRYAILYFFLLVVFVAVMVGPVVAGKYVPSSLMTSIPMELVQPTGLNNNDTKETPTGDCINGMKCPGPGGAEVTDTADSTLRRFMAY
jgi:1,3-beta-glucan synthase